MNVQTKKSTVKSAKISGQVITLKRKNPVTVEVKRAKPIVEVPKKVKSEEEFNIDSTKIEHWNVASKLTPQVPLNGFEEFTCILLDESGNPYVTSLIYCNKFKFKNDLGLYSKGREDANGLVTASGWSYKIACEEPNEYDLQFISRNIVMLWKGKPKITTKVLKAIEIMKSA